MSDYIWDDAAIIKLTALWAEGLTTAEIGRRMGVSKNAIVGKAGRLGLPPRPNPVRGKGAAPLPRIVRAPSAPIPKLVDLIAVAALPPTDVGPKGVKTGVNSGDTKGDAAAEPARAEPAHPAQAVAKRIPRPANGCAYPLWGTDYPTGLFCEAPALPGKPYCPEHHALCVVTVVKPRFVHHRGVSA